MKEQVAGPPTFPCNVHGFEDCRLFFWREQFWSTCTVRNRNPHGRCEVALLRLDDQRNIADVQILNGVHPEMHQKNWAPLVDDDELFLLYSTDPTIVLRYDLDDRQTHLYQVHHPKPCLKSFRGGSQAVSLPEGWIHLIHETHPLDDRRRVYLHRFVLLTKDFKVQAFTEPFYFAEKGVEFCAGLAYDRQRRRLIASFGVNDEDARLAFFDADAVLSRLEL